MQPRRMPCCEWWAGGRAGFHVLRHGVAQPVTATNPLFTAVALDALPRIPGTGRQHLSVRQPSAPRPLAASSFCGAK